MGSAIKISLVFFTVLGVAIIGIYLGTVEPELVKSMTTRGYDSSLRLPLPEEPLLFEDRLASTPLLLHAPVGGFNGPLFWLSGPDTLSYEYQFYSRGFGPGNVTLKIDEVEFPLSTKTVPSSPGINARITPDHFRFDPDDTITARLNITVLPEGYRHNATTRTFRVHADVDSMPNAVADDWIRVRMGDHPVTDVTRHSSMIIGFRDTLIRKNEGWRGNLTLNLAERDTGSVRIWFKELDCGSMAMSSLDTPQPQNTDWPKISVSPDEFVGRSYGAYNLTTTIDTSTFPVKPGIYCYGVYVDSAGGQSSTSFTIQVIP